MRLDADFKPLLAAARDIAARHGHSPSGLEHFLLAFAETSVGITYFSVRAIRIDRLSQALLARLAATRPVPGYRGSAAGELQLAAAIKRASAARGLLQRVFEAFAPLEPWQLADTLLEGEFATEAAAAKFDVGTVDTFWIAASAEAQRRGHQHLLSAHALFVAFDDPALKAPLEAVGINVSRLRAALDRRLRSPAANMPRLASRKNLVQAACVHANAHGVPPSVEHLVIMLLRSPLIARSWRRAKNEAFDVVYALVHRRLATTEPATTSGRFEVEFFNDHYSTMEFVVNVLTTVFELPDAEARAAMLCVHENGSVRVGSFSADEARERVSRARELARANGMPLRLEFVPVA